MWCLIKYFINNIKIWLCLNQIYLVRTINQGRQRIQYLKLWNQFTNINLSRVARSLRASSATSRLMTKEQDRVVSCLLDFIQETYIWKSWIFNAYFNGYWLKWRLLSNPTIWPICDYWQSNEQRYTYHKKNEALVTGNVTEALRFSFLHRWRILWLLKPIF